MQDSSSGVNYINNTAGQVVSEFDLNKTKIADYVYLNGVLLAKLLVVRDPIGVDPGDTLDPLMGGFSQTLLGPGGGGTTSQSSGPGGPGGGTCTFNSSTFTYYIRSKGKVIAEYGSLAAGANPSHRYIYAGDQRIAMRTSSDKLHYYLSDHLGSTRLVIDSAGNIMDNHTYYSFGETKSEVTSTGQSYKYTGKPLDDEGGLNLHYYGARYYDGASGRFCAVDPLANKYPALSPFIYTANNPIKYTDPDGRAINLVAAGIGAAIAGGIEFFDQWLIQDKSLSDINWTDVAGSATEGAITGAVAGLTGGASLFGAVVANGAAGVAGGLANSAITGEQVTLGGVVKDAIVGGVGGAAAKGATKLLGSAPVGKAITSSTTSVTVQQGIKKGIVIGARAGAKIGTKEVIDELTDEEKEEKREPQKSGGGE